MKTCKPEVDGYYLSCDWSAVTIFSGYNMGVTFGLI